MQIFHDYRQLKEAQNQLANLKLQRGSGQVDLKTFYKPWIQHRSATHPKLDFTSRGVLNPSTFLGRLFKLS